LKCILRTGRAGSSAAFGWLIACFQSKYQAFEISCVGSTFAQLKLCLMRALGHGAIFNASVSGSTDNPRRSADGAFKGGEISGAGTAVARWPRTGLKA
jgi:hypothetical protein